MKTHPARAARVAILHQWTNTQTEGWWRQAFDIYGVPYDYIDPETVKKTREPARQVRRHRLRAGRQPGGGRGTPMWQNPMPWKSTPETPNIGTWAQTDDTRIGMGLEGLIHLRDFIAKGGVFIGSNSSADFAITQQPHLRCQLRIAAGTRIARGRLAAAHEDRRRHEPDRVWRAGQPRDVQQQRRELHRQRHRGRRRARRWRRARRRAGRRGAAAPGGGRPTGRGTPDDPDVVQGRPADEGTQPERRCRRRSTTQPWQYALPTDEQLRRNPTNIIPPQFRPRVALRFDAQNTLLVSGLARRRLGYRAAAGCRGRAGGEGHVVLFANNPIYRGETIGSYSLVFNTILNFDSLNAGRKLDPK